MSWVEIGDHSFYGRFDPWDVNVGVVRGTDGLCVIDTRGSHRQGAELRDALARLGGPVVAVVNTHWHFDHVWGNAVFAREGTVIWGHERVPAAMERWFDDVRESLGFAHPEAADELDEIECTPPTRLVTTRASIDLGDRAVLLDHPGRGHTDGDMVVVATDDDVVFAGDLVEQSGPPAYGDDSHPLAWPQTATRVVDLLGQATRVVPGHGDHVDRTFCDHQRSDISTVAELLRELHAAGVPRRDALHEAAGRWPFPAERLREAVLRAWSELG